MANKKVTALTGLASPADGDLIYIVDVSDTTDGSDGTSKKITKANLVGSAMTTAVYDAASIAEQLVGLTATQTLTNKTLTSPAIGTGVLDTNDNELLTFTETASAVNEVDLANAATGNNPILSMTGGDTNVGFDIKMKGTGKFRKPSVVGIQVLSFDTATSTGNGQAFFRVPAELNGMNLTGVAASVYTAGTTNTLDIQIRNHTDTADMLSTVMTIDSTETDTSTAATPAVIDTANDDVVTGDIIAVDIDAVHTTAAKGLFVELRFELP